MYKSIVESYQHQRRALQTTPTDPKQIETLVQRLTTTMPVHKLLTTRIDQTKHRLPNVLARIEKNDTTLGRELFTSPIWSGDTHAPLALLATLPFDTIIDALVDVRTHRTQRVSRQALEACHLIALERLLTGDVDCGLQRVQLLEVRRTVYVRPRTDQHLPLTVEEGHRRAAELDLRGMKKSSINLTRESTTKTYSAFDCTIEYHYGTDRSHNHDLCALEIDQVIAVIGFLRETSDEKSVHRAINTVLSHVIDDAVSTGKRLIKNEVKRSPQTNVVELLATLKHELLRA
jgi:hypothetical protein